MNGQLLCWIPASAGMTNFSFSLTGILLNQVVSSFSVIHRIPTAILGPFSWYRKYELFIVKVFNNVCFVVRLTPVQVVPRNQ